MSCSRRKVDVVPKRSPKMVRCKAETPGDASKERRMVEAVKNHTEMDATARNKFASVARITPVD